MAACKNHFGKSDNIKVNINRETGEVTVFAEKDIVEDVNDPAMEISLSDAKKISEDKEIGDKS